LNSIIVGTDGLYDYLDCVNKPLNEITKAIAPKYNTGPGYQPVFFRELRGKLSSALNDSGLQTFERDHDDRTLIVLRRIPAGSDCQKSRKDML